MLSVAWSRAVVAGIVAGIVATVVQLALWAAFDHPPWELLLRDARLAAAIVLGADVLPPPVSFDLRVFAAATGVHVALSAIYGLTVAALIGHRRIAAALAIGAAFGAALFFVNMYGFTLLFPWFAEVRDPITFVVHPVFGATAALAYKWPGRAFC
jgi:hypothetical protein